MAPTPLLDALRAAGELPLASAGYRGAETASRYSEVDLEFSAIRQACGIYDLGFRARLSLTGADRVRWTNGMVTNNIRDLAVGHGVYSFLLNPQGRILGDMQIFNANDRLIIETDRSQVEKIAATFDHYIIMDDVEVANAGAEQSAIGLSGPRSRELLNAVGIEVGELQPLEMANPKCVCDCDCIECTVIRTEDSPEETYELWLPQKDLHQTWKALIKAGATPVGTEALEMQRVIAGIPLYGVDIRERDLPQETGQDRALNFSKGCYVGQEIVERIRSRGNVHRKLIGLIFESAAIVTSADKIFSGEKEVGEVTSIATMPVETGTRTVAMGYIRREAGIPGRTVQVSGVPAAIALLPINFISLSSTPEAVLSKA